jgi:hypothetical protein
MPQVYGKFKNGYNYGNDLQNESKKLIELIQENTRKKEQEGESQFYTGGFHSKMKAFDEKIAKKKGKM